MPLVCMPLCYVSCSMPLVWTAWGGHGCNVDKPQGLTASRVHSLECPCCYLLATSLLPIGNSYISCLCLWEGLICDRS
jgi:hypothetical protein